MSEVHRQNDGGPAFPSWPEILLDGNGGTFQPGQYGPMHTGLTVRDWFAGMIVQEVLRQAAGGG